MKRFSKLSVAVLIALLCAISFAACGDGGNKTDAPVVTFMSDGKVHATVEAKAGASLPAPPQKEGQTFDGWFLDDEAFLQPFTTLSGVTANATVYAKWTPAGQGSQAVTVTFISNNETHATVTADSSAVMPQNPQREGLVFGGWFLDNGTFLQPFTSLSGVTSNIAVYAKWAVEPPPSAEALAFITVVGSLGTISFESNIILAAALARYNALTEAEKARTDVTAAKSAYNSKKAEYDALVTAAQAEAAPTEFVALVGAIPKTDEIAPTKADGAKIAAARSCYGTLTETAKGLFDVAGALLRLVEAEQKFAGFEGKMVLLTVIRASTTMTGPNFGSTSGKAPYDADMNGSMLWAAAESAKLAASALDAGDFIGIVSFSQTATTRLSVSPASRADDIDAALSGVTSVQGTSYGNAVARAQAVMGEISDTCKKHTLFISGGAGSNETALQITEYRNAIETMAAEGATLSVIDVSQLTSNSTVHKPMSDAGGGAYYHMPCDIFSGNLNQAVLQREIVRVKSPESDSIKDITSVAVPAGTTSIDAFAFLGYNSLVSVTIPSSVLSIGEGAFADCAALTDITIPASVSNIGERAFYDCAALTNITIPASVSSIGDNAFLKCSGLTSITVASGNTAYKSDGDCLIRISDNVLIAGCNSSVIPGYVTGIGDYAFYKFTALTSITIPSSVTSAGRRVFSGCRNLSITWHYNPVLGRTSLSDYLTEVIIPDSVTGIGIYAFDGCANLASVTIPDSVQRNVINQDCPQTCKMESCA
ncbi:MAG: leucine-rich repeat protein [Firmicutes bacterium]|nr:leucine-rich repeat protein [Bacillota bacterium]